MCSFFFYKSYGAPRYLHSFPTRRSSDLTLGGKRQGSENAQKFLETQIHDYEKRLRSAEDRLAEFKKQDRKSTRLNSSHQIISYAVFCLKKKNEHNAQSERRYPEHTDQER